MTLDRLRDLLQAAVKLELSTIPPYLCALYSMHPKGNDEAKLVIRSVVVEDPATIGAFYAEIVDHLTETSAAIGEQNLFCGDPARQITREYHCAGGGSPAAVTDLASARQALAEIVEQGEGDMESMYDDDGDLAHYYPMLANPRGTDYANPACVPPQTWPTAAGQSSCFSLTARSTASRPHSYLRCIACSSSAMGCSSCSPTRSPTIRGGMPARPSSGTHRCHESTRHSVDPESGVCVNFPRGATERTDHGTASEVFYDAVVVGSGISGAIIANELSRAGKRVLILEAGPGGDRTLRGYRFKQLLLGRYYQQGDEPDDPTGPPLEVDWEAVYGRVRNGAQQGESTLDDLLRRDIFSEEKLGPVTRNIIKLWYVGVWYELPLAWREAFGALDNDVTFTVSAAAYTEGLLWPAIGASPPGAKAPGYGSWAGPPRIPAEGIAW